MRKGIFLAALAALVFMGGMAINELAPPAIESVPVPGDEPLTLRFAVSNRAWLTTIRDVDFTCVPDRIEGKGATGATGDPFPLNVNLDIGPGASFQYTCPVKGAPLPEQVTAIRAHVEMRFTRFGRRSEARSGELAWNSQSKVWVKEP